jgi:hypothetical protein
MVNQLVEVMFMLMALAGFALLAGVALGMLMLLYWAVFGKNPRDLLDDIFRRIGL